MNYFIKLISLVISLSCFNNLYAVEFEDFQEFEIRVVRPRFFNKTYKFELGAHAFGVVNDTYKDTLLAGGGLSFYLTEWLGLEGYGAYGVSLERKITDTLADKNIDIVDSKLESIYGGSLIISPMYGKFQIASGQLFYFDSFMSIGGGLSNLRYNYDYCKVAIGGEVGRSREPQTVSYPTMAIGVGQHFFMSRNASMRWDYKSSWYTVYASDSGCDKNAEKSKGYLKNSLMLQVGFSYFLGG